MAFKYDKYKESDAVRAAAAQRDKYANYTQSASVKAAQKALEEHEKTKAPTWTGGTYGEALNEAMDKINNREKFNYDLAGDMLYNQYKDQYISQGKLAMQDTLGQVAALTGGYGNSYATTAGNQAYQGYLQQLNDRIPDLYNMALSRYQMEGQDLKDQYAMLNDANQTEYGRYRDAVGDWNAENSRLTDRYYNEANMDWTRFSDNRDFANNAYTNERNFDYGKYTDGYNQAFASYQQQISEDQFAKQLALEQARLDEQIRANRASEAKARSSGSGNYIYEDSEDSLGNSPYADWTAVDWREYFDAIRVSDGSAKAMSELKDFIAKGYIPQESIASANVGAGLDEGAKRRKTNVKSKNKK